jgi:dihydrofolate reductase
MIKAIMAMDEKWGIGKNNSLPWPHNPHDLSWFKKHTVNTAVVMGGNTWRSLPVQPLPNRRNIVVSKTITHWPLVEIVHPSMIRSRLAWLSGDNDIWVIGGNQLVEHVVGMIDEFWISEISGSYDCDVKLNQSLIESYFGRMDRHCENSVNYRVYSKP